ncbi:substrate-binding domain-containing protein [Laceyella putida]|uniref:Substrate-binding domain-containing protein n=1 Tax=Laceyella putida TaxID=110101 RepID=A0ABW2RFN2_9BACL
MINQLQNRLKEKRVALGMTQEEVAKRIGVTRQLISSIEAGNSNPTVLVALKLSELFACRMEDLFYVDDPSHSLIQAEYFASSPDQGQGEHRVAVARIDNRIIARPLDGVDAGLLPLTPANGIVQRSDAEAVQVELLDDRQALAAHLFLAGCDIGLGLLSRHAERSHPSQSVFWFHANNLEAVTQLKKGQAHIAAIHYQPGEETALCGEFPFATKTIRFALWEQGWMVRKGNPKRFVGGADLVRPDIHLVNRERGAGARHLLDAELAKEGVPVELVNGYDREVSSHAAVADAVQKGLADVGVGLASAARLYGLDFIPLRQECCDLIIPASYLGEEAVQNLLHTLNSGVFRKDLQSFGPYIM